MRSINIVLIDSSLAKSATLKASLLSNAGVTALCSRVGGTCRVDVYGFSRAQVLHGGFQKTARVFETKSNISSSVVSVWNSDVIQLLHCRHPLSRDLARQFTLAIPKNRQHDRIMIPNLDSTAADHSPLTLGELNEINQKFYDQQSLLLTERISNEVIREAALENLAWEYSRGVPVRHQQTLESALARAQQVTDRFLEPAQKGGRAQKADSLQILIRDLVAKDPNITRGQLLRLLNRQVGEGVIDSIDNTEIRFHTEKGRTKTVRVSGLKHRLSRAKKRKLRSR